MRWSLAIVILLAAASTPARADTCDTSTDAGAAKALAQPATPVA